jgi:hypothetical protein
VKRDPPSTLYTPTPTRDTRYTHSVYSPALASTRPSGDPLPPAPPQVLLAKAKAAENFEAAKKRAGWVHEQVRDSSLLWSPFHHTLARAGCTSR